MSGPPPGPGANRAMSVGNGPPSAGLAPHNSMAGGQGSVPPPAGGATGPQSQQNLNQIVSIEIFSFHCALFHFWLRVRCFLESAERTKYV